MGSWLREESWGILWKCSWWQMNTGLHYIRMNKLRESTEQYCVNSLSNTELSRVYLSEFGHTSCEHFFRFLHELLSWPSCMNSFHGPLAWFPFMVPLHSFKSFKTFHIAIWFIFRLAFEDTKLLKTIKSQNGPLRNFCCNSSPRRDLSMKITEMCSSVYLAYAFYTSSYLTPVCWYYFLPRNCMSGIKYQSF